MKSISIEWKHLDKDDRTCDRCSDTGEAIRSAIKNLSKELKDKDIEPFFKETKLTESEIKDSNTVLINGKKIEDILERSQSKENHCSSCSCLVGKDVNCRTIEYEGNQYEDIPEELIVKAIRKLY